VCKHKNSKSSKEARVIYSLFSRNYVLVILLSRLSGDSNSGYDSGYSGRDSEASSVVANPDLQASVPQILQNLEAIRTSQQHLLQLWHHKKLKLDQCFQLRLFEQDCEKVWSFSRRQQDMIPQVSKVALLCARLPVFGSQHNMHTSPRSLPVSYPRTIWGSFHGIERTVACS
jgi:hypothetical protein